EHLRQDDLDSLAKKYIGQSKDDSIYEKLAEIFGGRPTRQAQMPNLHRAPVSIVAPYAKRDTRVAMNLWQWQEKEIKRQGLEQVWDLEKRLFPVVVRME